MRPDDNLSGFFVPKPNADIVASLIANPSEPIRRIAIHRAQAGLVMEAKRVIRLLSKLKGHVDFFAVGFTRYLVA